MELHKTNISNTARATGPKIAAIGGGTGLSTLLRGFKKLTGNITAIVTVADDGGGSGVLRHELGMLPPGDIRNCILALANTEPTMEKVLNYRFGEGNLTGQSFGNLFLAALNGCYGSFDEAVRRMSEVLAVTGKVLPVTTTDVYLEAEFENGTTVLGVSKIFLHKKENPCRITKVRLIPEHPTAQADAVAAIMDADMIVFGPGSLYTSIIPNLLVDGITEAVLASKAMKVYVMNIMTQEGETENYTASDHIRAIFTHSSQGLFDKCLVNTQTLPGALIEKYKTEDAGPTSIDLEAIRELGVEVIGRPLLGHHEPYARHDYDRLAAELIAILKKMN